MTRAECEAAIYHKMVEIKEIYKQYNPNPRFLFMSIIDDHFSCNNDYTLTLGENDKDYPLTFFKCDGFDCLDTSFPTDDRPDTISLDGKEWRKDD